MASRDVPWAEYTGTISPFGDIKPCWCAWRNDLPLFMIPSKDSFLVAIGGEQVQFSTPLNNAQDAAWILAKNGKFLPTGINRAHILNFQKK